MQSEQGAESRLDGEAALVGASGEHQLVHCMNALIEDCKREAEHGRWQISDAREEPNAILWNIYLFVLPLIRI